MPMKKKRRALPEQSDPHHLKRVALRLLTRRDYSECGIRKILKIKGFDEADIHTVLLELIQAGYVNDSRFTENYIASRRNRGYGPLRILRELQMHGIADQLIAEYLKITDNTWLALVQNVWQKHFKGQCPTDVKHRAKQMRFLLYRGFTEEQAMSVINNRR